MEVLGRQPCKREEEFGWGIVHPSSAHQLFDEMSSPFEVYEEDIILVMKEEKVSRDEALRLLLEEWMDAKRKLEEKLNRVLEKFEEMEAHNGAEDATVIIKAATTDLREASSPTPKTSLSPVCFNENSMHAATSSSHNIELTALTVAKCLKGCSNHGVGAGSLMPTRCPTNCSSPGVIPDHTMATVVACATTSMAFMELVVGEEATCDTYTGTTNCPEVTHTKCSTLGLDVKGDTDQVMVAFLAQPCVFLLNMDNTGTKLVNMVEVTSLQTWAPPCRVICKGSLVKKHPATWLEFEWKQHDVQQIQPWPPPQWLETWLFLSCFSDVAPHDSVSPFIIDIIPYALDDREEMLRRSIELRPCTHPQYLGKGKYWAGTAMSYGGNHLLAVKRLLARFKEDFSMVPSWMSWNYVRRILWSPGCSLLSARELWKCLQLFCGKGELLDGESFMQRRRSNMISYEVCWERKFISKTYSDSSQNWFELYTSLSSELWQKPTGYKLMQSEATSGATYLISADWTITESCKLSYKITLEDGEVDVYWLNTKDQEFSYEQLIFHKEELATVWVYQSTSFIKSKGSGRVVTIAASTSFTNSIPVPLASHVWKEFSWTLHYWNDGSVWKLWFCYMVFLISVKQAAVPMDILDGNLEESDPARLKMWPDHPKYVQRPCVNQRDELRLSAPDLQISWDPGGLCLLKFLAISSLGQVTFQSVKFSFQDSSSLFHMRSARICLSCSFETQVFCWQAENKLDIDEAFGTMQEYWRNQSGGLPFLQFTCHRLVDKSNFKERRLSGTH